MLIPSVLCSKYALRNYLKSSISRSSPNILLITSEPPETGSGHKVIGDYVNQAKFTVGIQMGLKTMQAKCSSAYATPQVIDEILHLAKRGGAIQNIVCVGSGAALDCAKAVATILSSGEGFSCHEFLKKGTIVNNEFKNGTDIDLVLSPVTLSAAMASMSRASLVFDPNEEALIPLPFNMTGKVTVAIDETQIIIERSNNTSMKRDGQGGKGVSVEENALASLSIAIDAALHSSMYGEESSASDHYSPYLTGEDADKILDLTVTSVAEILSNDCSAELTKQHSINASIHAAQLLRYGEHDGSLLSRRSLPVALASALLPPYFPHGNLLSFYAAICSGLCKTAIKSGRETGSLRRIAAIVTGKDESSCDELLNWIDAKANEYKVPTLASLAEGTADVNELANAVDANQALFGFDDGPLSPYFDDVIRHSLNR